MLYELCLELNNFFEYARYIGDVAIVDGNVQTELLEDGQYFRIVGSVFNDGVYQYPQRQLKDEVYHGGLWAMAVPAEVIALNAEIDAWKQKYLTLDGQALSPYTSESFGGYSYTKGASGDTSSASWQGVFANRLNKWRKFK
jgi:hypothetical protein